MGYWGDWQSVRDGMEDTPASLALISEFTFHKCANEQQCTNSCGMDYDAADISGPIVKMAEKQALRECRSNVTNICQDSYTDTLCSLCDVGFFSLGGRCLRCLQPTVPFVIGCVCLIIAAWYLINRCVPV
jgi:hypothetical protein